MCSCVAGVPNASHQVRTHSWRRNGCGTPRALDGVVPLGLERDERVVVADDVDGMHVVAAMARARRAPIVAAERAMCESPASRGPRERRALLARQQLGIELLGRANHPIDREAVLDRPRAARPSRLASDAVVEQARRPRRRSRANRRAATSRPVSPSTSASGVPPTRVATTGAPAAIDSSSTFDSASLSDGITETSTRRQQRRHVGAQAGEDHAIADAEPVGELLQLVEVRHAPSGWSRRRSGTGRRDIAASAWPRLRAGARAPSGASAARRRRRAGSPAPARARGGCRPGRPAPSNRVRSTPFRMTTIFDAS